MSKQKKLNKTQIEKMKEMYMSYVPISEIASTFKVVRATVTWHINSNAWQAERKLAENEVFSSFTDAKKTDFVKMTQSAVNIMSRSLEALATRHEPPSMTEATRAADILKTLDNILRLDEGKPTDIVENQDKPLTSKELKKKISVDPFANLDSEEKDEKLN
jgi:predicted DNA-binding protein YlxM (UPF0122 family)